MPLLPSIPAAAVCDPVAAASAASLVVASAVVATCPVMVFVAVVGEGVVGLGVVGFGSAGTGAATVTTEEPWTPLIVFLLCASYASDCDDTEMVAVPLSFARNVMVPSAFAVVNPPGNPAVFVTLPAVMLS